MGAGRFWVHVVETFSQLYVRQATRAHCVTAACRLGTRGPRQGHSAQCTAAAGLRGLRWGGANPLCGHALCITQGASCCRVRALHYSGHTTGHRGM